MPLDEPLVIEADVAGDSVELHLRGELDIATVSAFSEAMANYVCDDLRVVELNMRDLEFLDSTGVGAIVQAHHALEENGTQLILVSPSRTIMTRLNVYQLDRLLTIDLTP